MQNVDLIKQKFETLCPFMDERMRRLWAAAEARAQEEVQARATLEARIRALEAQLWRQQDDG